MEELNPEEIKIEIIELEEKLMDILEVMSDFYDAPFFPIHLEIHWILRRIEHLEGLKDKK